MGNSPKRIMKNKGKYARYRNENRCEKNKERKRLKRERKKKKIRTAYG